MHPVDDAKMHSSRYRRIRSCQQQGQATTPLRLHYVSDIHDNMEGPSIETGQGQRQTWRSRPSVARIPTVRQLQNGGWCLGIAGQRSPSCRKQCVGGWGYHDLILLQLSGFSLHLERLVDNLAHEVPGLPSALLIDSDAKLRGRVASSSAHRYVRSTPALLNNNTATTGAR
jgi:hypothetical protein